MRLIHNGLDDKIKGWSYKVERVWSVRSEEMLQPYMAFFDLMSKRLAHLDKRGILMTEHNDIDN